MGGQGGEGSPSSAGSGQGGSATDPVAAPGPVTFACDTAARFESPPMRRLTKRQYENTVTDLVARLMGDAGAESVLGEVQASFNAIPDDRRKQLPEDLHGSYRRLDQDVAQEHVEGWYTVAVSLGTAMTTPERLGQVVGSCATDADTGNDAACLDDFITRLGEIAFRRPLSIEEAEQLRAFYEPSTGVDPLGFADVIAGTLSLPQFLYLVEHGADDAPADAPVIDLSAFELASRLSYHFWDSMPDVELYESARTGALLELEEYQRQLQRLFEDPRTRETVRSFARDWLKLDDLEDLTKNLDAPIFQGFAGENLPSEGLREAMIEEVVDLVDYFTWVDPQGIETILTTDLSFARSPELAAIYGVEPWDGASPPPSFPAGERPGVLTRAAFLATGTAMTRPIMRGVFMRRNVLCDSIPPPPDNAAANAPELSETLSTRQVVEALTESPGTPCASCHGLFINPLGFAFEGFDALGRVRHQQTLFAEDGSVLTNVPIDTTTTPQINVGDEAPSNGPGDLMSLAIESGKAQACVSRHYFRFTFGRWEDVDADGCILEGIRTSLTDSGNLAQMLKDVAATDAFRQRTFD